MGSVGFLSSRLHIWRHLSLFKNIPTKRFRFPKIVKYSAEITELQSRPDDKVSLFCTLLATADNQKWEKKRNNINIFSVFLLVTNFYSKRAKSAPSNMIFYRTSWSDRRCGRAALSGRSGSRRVGSSEPRICTSRTRDRLSRLGTGLSRKPVRIGTPDPARRWWCCTLKKMTEKKIV